MFTEITEHYLTDLEAQDWTKVWEERNDKENRDLLFDKELRALHLIAEEKSEALEGIDQSDEDAFAVAMVRAYERAKRKFDAEFPVDPGPAAALRCRTYRCQGWFENPETGGLL